MFFYKYVKILIRNNTSPSLLTRVFRLLILPKAVSFVLSVIDRPRCARSRSGKAAQAQVAPAKCMVVGALLRALVVCPQLAPSTNYTNDTLYVYVFTSMNKVCAAIMM
jgi:hypothetical protein